VGEGKFKFSGFSIVSSSIAARRFVKLAAGRRCRENGEKDGGLDGLLVCAKKSRQEGSGGWSLREIPSTSSGQVKGYLEGILRKLEKNEKSGV